MQRITEIIYKSYNICWKFMVNTVEFNDDLLFFQKRKLCNGNVTKQSLLLKMGKFHI